MNTLLFICHCHSTTTPSSFTSYSPIYVAILVFILNIIRKNYYRKREIRRTINNSIFESCEKIIRYAIQSNYALLTHRYYYSLSEKENKEENRKYSDMFYEKSDSYRMKMLLIQVELIKHMQDYKNHGDKNEAMKIDELLLHQGDSHVSEWAAFTPDMDISEINKVYQEKKKEIPLYIEEQSICKYLRKIQQIVHPDYPYDKILKSIKKDHK